MTEVPADRHTVLIADDHQVLAEGLAATLGQHYTIVGQVHVLEQVRSAIERSAPDVVILDVSFHGESSLRELKQLTADPAIASRFVVLTGLESPALATAAFNAGATAFLQKGAGVQELRLAIEAAVAGRRYSDGAESQGTTELAGGARGASVMVGGLLLRPRQVEVIWLALRGLGRVAIAERLGVTEKTVDYHLTDLRERLGVDTSRMVIAWAAGYQDELSMAFTGLQREGKRPAGGG
ncbi:MAG: response regulator transcription factor [Gemmatimonadetes bacterium]|nr:response regulator transcription factor [Gemmatimonadota bacterium]